MRGFETVSMAAATVSRTIDCTDGKSVVGIQTPASIASATMTLQGSVDGGTFTTITDVGGSSYSVTLTASRYIPIKKELLDGVPYVRLVFASSETANFLLATRP